VQLVLALDLGRLLFLVNQERTGHRLRSFLEDQERQVQREWQVGWEDQAATGKMEKAATFYYSPG
jgi:hypothetical protein